MPQLQRPPDQHNVLQAAATYLAIRSLIEFSPASATRTKFSARNPILHRGFSSQPSFIQPAAHQLFGFIGNATAMQLQACN
jgi:hypothetical protein